LASQEEHTTSLDATSESGAPSESEERTKELLAAYQGTLDVAEDLPAVVWVRWGDRGLGHFLKVPYFRWFLRYFLTHHISESLSALNRRLHAIAALANDPDTNKANRETVKLYLQSLPPPPYRKLVFVVVIAAVLLAVPLRGFGNVLDVLPLVGALLRVDITYVARAFTGAELGATVLALFLAMSWDLILEVDTGAPANVNVTLPEVHWIFYALPAIVFLVAFCVLLKRLIVAWRGRNGPTSV
jgi:hypothetical protein